MYTNFLKSRTCYDIMPKSSKIVVFDTKLRVGTLLLQLYVHRLLLFNKNYTVMLNLYYLVLLKVTTHYKRAQYVKRTLV